MTHETTTELSAATTFERPPSDPMVALRSWFADAKSRVQEPGALALATTGPEGRASTRMVQVLEVRDDDLAFTTHINSQKGREIAATGWASGVFYWRETKQQVILSGQAAPLSAQVADLLWAQRSPTTYPMSIASQQSDILEDEEALRQRAQDIARSGEQLPRPDGWLGYALRPAIVEFWESAPDRLHKRLRYDLAASGWTSHRLQP